jgi:ABC-type nitrate/sulfonate/bicarbonate transport system substrate-binding protein
VLTVDGDLARHRPEIVARYLATLMRAAHWAADNAEETLTIVSSDVGATPEWVTAAYGPEVHRRLDIDLDARNIVAVGRLKGFLLEQAIIDSDFDLQTWIDPRPLALAGELLREHRGG